GCQQDLRGGADEVAAVVLPDSEQVQADLIGQLRLFDRLPHPLLWRGGLAGGQVLGDLTEGHDADLESHMHSSSLGRPGPEPRGSKPRGSTPRGSTPRGSTPRGSTPRGSTPPNPVRRRSPTTTY